MTKPIKRPIEPDGPQVDDWTRYAFGVSREEFYGMSIDKLRKVVGDFRFHSQHKPIITIPPPTVEGDGEQQ